MIKQFLDGQSRADLTLFFIGAFQEAGPALFPAKTRRMNCEDKGTLVRK